MIVPLIAVRLTYPIVLTDSTRVPTEARYTLTAESIDEVLAGGVVQTRVGGAVVYIWRNILQWRHMGVMASKVTGNSNVQQLYHTYNEENMKQALFHWNGAASSLATNVLALAGPHLNIMHCKDRRSWDRLVFIMGIPILECRHLYIETPPSHQWAQYWLERETCHQLFFSKWQMNFRRYRGTMRSTHWCLSRFLVDDMINTMTPCVARASAARVLALFAKHNMSVAH